MGSKEYFNFFVEARRMMFNGELNDLSYFDKEILEGDLGKFATYEGEEIPLDFPLVEEDEKVELNKPKRWSKSITSMSKTTKGM